MPPNMSFRIDMLRLQANKHNTASWVRREPKRMIIIFIIVTQRQPRHFVLIKAASP
jgi:hypothetical protein